MKKRDPYWRLSWEGFVSDQDRKKKENDLIDADLSYFRTLLEKYLSTTGEKLEFICKHNFGRYHLYVNGNVFASISKYGTALKIKESEQDEFYTNDCLRLRYGPYGSPELKEYLVIPIYKLYDEETMLPWIKFSVDYALSG